MSWNARVFAYCERGLDPAFWAEPLNAASNAAFFIAAFAALAHWLGRPADRRGIVELLLVLLVFAIGTGSFLFHTLATRWAGVADTLPIGIFMVAYLIYAVRRFAAFPWWAVALCTAVFVATLPVASMARCGGGPCFNGSLAYAPALGALALIGGALTARRHPAGPLVLAGGLVFALSLVFRSVDRAVCPFTIIAASRAVGTHFVWHTLNGILLYLLLRAAIRHGRRVAQQPAAIA